MTPPHQRTTPSMPPAGWYQDPGGSGRERYWEGTRWTRNLRDAPADTTPVATLGPAPVTSTRAPRAPMPGPEAIRLKPGVARTQDGMPLAHFGLRAAATLLDSLVIGLLGALVGLPYLVRVGRSIMQAQREGNTTADMSRYDYATPLLLLQGVILVTMFLTQVLLVKLFGATLGQLAMGVRVVPTDQGLGRPGLGWAQSLKRSAIWLAIAVVSLWALGVPMLYNYLRPLWNPRRQTLHDVLSGTQVIAARDHEAEVLMRAHAFRERVQAHQHGQGRPEQ